MAVRKNDPYSSDPANDELVGRRSARLDNELQPDPELAEGPAGGGRIALFAVAVIAILGVVFYGLNNSTVTPSSSTAQTNTTTPATPPGQTTGSATQTSPPPAAGQPGDNANGSATSGTSGSTSTPSMSPAPSPSTGGTTQSGSSHN